MQYVNIYTRNHTSTHVKIFYFLGWELSPQPDVTLEAEDSHIRGQMDHNLKNIFFYFLRETMEHLKENATLFPVEVDLSQNAFQYKSTMQIIQVSDTV